MSPVLAAPTAIEPYLERVRERVVEHQLDNGIKFIILPEDEAPTISFVTYADVGGVDEEPNKTGAAHFLEHLAFKGTTRIGTTDYQQEAPLLAEMDRLFTRIQSAKSNGKAREVERLQAQFDRIRDRASQYIKPNEYGRIVQTEGGSGLNAATSADYTIYFYSFPANKLELWMSLESERFLDPVFREFYSEKDVILEERRQRTDNSPIGQLVEAFLDTAFVVHPYKRPVIGYEEDIRNLRREDIRTFFETHYLPDKLTMAVVGDVDPQEVIRLAEIYFGRYQPRSRTLREIPPEPPQQQPREVTLNFPSQPIYLAGYHRPALSHPDDPVYDIISLLLSEGRTSRLYRSLVQDKQVALSASGGSSFPGNKYPHMVLFYIQPAPGNTDDDVAAALEVELDRLRDEPVSEEELQRVKTQARAKLLRAIDSNSGMARLLAEYDGKTGNWENLFEDIEALAAVSPQDVQRVARSTFRPENRTVARIVPSRD